VKEGELEDYYNKLKNNKKEREMILKELTMIGFRSMAEEEKKIKNKK